MGNKRNKQYAQFRDALAGAFAGATAKTVVAPIERVKLLMQLQNSLEKPTYYERQSAWQVARTVYREQGLLAFWRGNTPNVIRQGGTAALNFMLMDWYKATITPIVRYTTRSPSSSARTQRRARWRSQWSSFLSGGLAGGTTTTVLYPVEFLRTRLAMDVGNSIETTPRKYPRGMRDVLAHTWKSDGIAGLYQGYGIALGGVVLYRALHLGGYDALKTELLHHKQQQSINDNNNDDEPAVLTLLERFLAAQTVSLVAGTVCYPIDSVRRRLMMQAGVPLEERLYRNSIDCFVKIYAQEGMRGFFLGLGPNVVRSFGGALLLVGYDVFKGMIY